MSFNYTTVNKPIDDLTTRMLRTYLKFPEGEQILGVDLNARNGSFLDSLVSKHRDNGEAYLYGAAKDSYEYSNLYARNKFHKIFHAHYKSEAKMTKEVFSLGIVDAGIERKLYNQLFDTVDTEMFVEPDYEERARKVLELEQETKQLNLADEDLSEEQLLEREEYFKKRLEEEILNSKKVFRAATRSYESKLAVLRDDAFLLSRITERLMVGGILIMITPKELIDQTITVRLHNQFEDLRIIRPESDVFLSQRKCIIIGRKRAKNAKDKVKGILLAETKFKSYKDIEEIQLLKEPLYKVPKSNVEYVETFRVGPLTGQEVSVAAKKSSLLENFQKKYSQTMTEQAPTAPATLKKGHVMMLLTSGYLHGYIGEGPNKHLVKGSATKLSRTQQETNDEGVTLWKEREFYSISVKYLTRDGEFHQLM